MGSASIALAKLAGENGLSDNSAAAAANTQGSAGKARSSSATRFNTTLLISPTGGVDPSPTGDQCNAFAPAPLVIDHGTMFTICLRGGRRVTVIAPRGRTDGLQQRHIKKFDAVWNGFNVGDVGLIPTVNDTED